MLIVESLRSRSLCGSFVPGDFKSWMSPGAAKQIKLLSFFVWCAVCVCVFLFWGVIWTPKLSKVFANHSCLTKIRNDTSLLSIFEQLWPFQIPEVHPSNGYPMPTTTPEPYHTTRPGIWNLARISFNVICRLVLILSHQHVVVSPHILAS